MIGYTLKHIFMLAKSNCVTFELIKPDFSGSGQMLLNTLRKEDQRVPNALFVLCVFEHQRFCAPIVRSAKTQNAKTQNARRRIGGLCPSRSPLIL